MNKIKVNPSSYYLILILLIGGIMVGFSQEKTIEGNITDENGLPLPGATVIEQGTNNGTTTDFDGNYQISTQEGNILILSYVGYTDQELVVVSSNQYSTQMQLDTNLE